MVSAAERSVWRLSGQAGGAALGDSRGLLSVASDRGTAGMGVDKIENTRKCICRVERTRMNSFVYWTRRVRVSQRLRKLQVASRWLVNRLD